MLIDLFVRFAEKVLAGTRWSDVGLAVYVLISDRTLLVLRPPD